MAQFQRSLTLGVVFLAAALGSGLSAPTSPAAAKPAPIAVSAVWLRGQAPDGIELLAAIGESTPLPLAVGGSNRGRPTEFTGSAASVRLLKRPPAPIGGLAAGVPAPAPISLGDISWPAGSPKKVLLVLAAPKDASAVKGLALADDETAFPTNTVRLVNFTGVPVLMRLNQTVKPVGAGASEVFPYAVLGDAKVKDVPNFPFALAAGDTVFFNGRIDSWPNSRTLVLVGPVPSGGKSPVVQILIDRVAPPVAPAKK